MSMDDTTKVIDWIGKTLEVVLDQFLRAKWILPPHPPIIDREFAVFMKNKDPLSTHLRR